MKKLIINTKRLNVREKPSLSSKILHTLKRGEIVDLIKFSDNYYWAKIRISSNGLVGWSSFKYMLGVPEPSRIRTNDNKWLKIAFGELEIKELKDPLENSRIIQYLNSCEESLAKIDENSDETHWCSAFANWCLEKSGYEGTNSTWALHWRYWGVELKKPRRGCITVFKRFIKNSQGQTKTFGHVGFYLGEDKDQIKILGGNQSNSVNISNYPKKNNKYELVGYRFPY